MPSGGDEFAIHLGADGIPFITGKKHVPIYTKDDGPRKAPQYAKKPRVDVFDLSDEKDMEKYNRIWEAVGHGLVRVAVEDRQWMPDVKNWKVFIRWFIAGAMDPSEARTEALRTGERLGGFWVGDGHG